MLWITLSALLPTACLAGLYGLTLWRARRAEMLYPPSGQFVDVNGLRLHYIRRGPSASPDRPTIVLLHGSDGFWQDFAGVMDLLANDYDVIALDRPGHGYSDTPDLRFAAPDAQADLVHEALLRLDIPHPLLVGYSWSGALALAYALKYPDDTAGLTLISAWMYAPDTLPLWLLRLPDIPLVGPILAATLPILVKGHFLRHYLAAAFAPDPVPAEYARQAFGLWQRAARQARFFARENLADRPVMRALAPRYADITLPVVLLSGERDREVPPVQHSLRLRDALPHAELILLANAGHALPQTRPGDVAGAVTRCHALTELTASGNAPQRIGMEQETPSASEQEIEEATEAAGSKAKDGARGNTDRARDLVMRWGWNAMCYQLLAPDMEHWFSRDGDAVAGFARRSGVRVVAGGPVCDPARLGDVVADFERDASLNGETVCYFGAAQRMDGLLSGLADHDRVAIGAQPVWNPANWPGIVGKNSSLRAQIQRARNKGVVVTEWPSERARTDAGLKRCLDEWMATHPFPQMHFLTEAVSLDRLMDRRVFVAVPRTDPDAPVAFLIATPVPQRRGWLVEQIARGQNAPNGAAELLIDAMMRAFGDEGADYVTLGLAPLSRRARAPDVITRPWLRLALRWVRAHGQRFYNFDGLDAFKAKFRPDAWEPLYAISNETRFSPRTLYAIAAAFSDGAPLSALSRALASALKQELVWLRARLQTGERRPK